MKDAKKDEVDNTNPSAEPDQNENIEQEEAGEKLLEKLTDLNPLDDAKGRRPGAG